MSKKKKKKQHKKAEARQYLMNQIKDVEFDDKWINSTYEDLFDEIALYQYELYKADRKYLENQYKKNKKHKNGKSVFYTDSKPVKKRKKIIKKLEKKNFFDRAIHLLEELKPLAKLISRIVSILIITLLNIPCIKDKITTRTMNKIDGLYRVCMTF